VSARQERGAPVQGDNRAPTTSSQPHDLAVDGIVRYTGTEEECQRRLQMLAPKNDRAEQDKALARLGRLMR
jgi:hypothetical protein